MSKTRTIIETIRHIDLDSKLLNDAERVMTNGQYIDRWLTLLPGGRAYLTTRDHTSIQYPLPVVMDAGLTKKCVRLQIIRTLAEAIRHAEVPMIDSDTGEELGDAHPYDLMESWLAGFAGHIVRNIRGADRTVYCQI